MERIYNILRGPLSKRVKQYFELRGYKVPDKYEAFTFLVSEVGELGDALNHSSSEEWVRNNPDQKHSRVSDEVADVLMMLVSFTIAAGIEEEVSMLMQQKMIRKLKEKCKDE